MKHELPSPGDLAIVIKVEDATCEWQLGAVCEVLFFPLREECKRHAERHNNPEWLTEELVVVKIAHQSDLFIGPRRHLLKIQPDDHTRVASLLDELTDTLARTKPHAKV